MRFLDNRRDGILSLADARRDANIARRGARDQYESDVADFIDNEVTDIENSFMSGGDSNDIPLNIQSPMRIDDFPPDMFVPPEVFDEPIYVPPVDFIWSNSLYSLLRLLISDSFTCIPICESDMKYKGSLMLKFKTIN